MSEPVLRTVTRLQGNNAALKSGAVKPAGFSLEFEEVAPLPRAFRRMVRGLEFDVCEMALTTYVCAREHGVRFTGLPVFLVRAFHHGAIFHHVERPIRDPKSLEGKRVGVSRGYTVTTGVWARAVLQDEYGVDLDNVTWVLSGDEHVEAYRPPDNVVAMPEGATIEGLLGSGDLAAAINIKPEDPAIEPFIADPVDAGLAAYESRGHYPINHLIAVRNDVLEAHPDVAVALYDAFSESKQIYIEKLERGDIESPDPMDRLYARMLELGHDPLPYGVEKNRGALEELIKHATTQQILRKPVDIEALFAPSTLSL